MARVIPLPATGAQPLNIAGQLFPAGPDGTINVPSKYVVNLLQHGYALAPDEVLSGSAGQIPDAACIPGMQVFDTVNNKPVWRNATNSGWVDATGTAVTSLGAAGGLEFQLYDHSGLLLPIGLA